jgi:hypothetical protein
LASETSLFVERDIEAARLVDHGLQMLDHSLLVESVDRRRLGGSAGGNDVLGDRFDWRQLVRGEKEIGALRRKGACEASCALNSFAEPFDAMT